MTIDLQHLLDAQNDLQTRSYGAAPAAMSDESKVQFIKDMILAATDELHEMLAEVPAWKPWVDRELLIKNGKPLFNEDAYIGEWIDLFHFVMNLALVMDLDAKKINDLYFKKHKKNANRQIEGYDGVSTKCGVCGRALDDDAVKCFIEDNSDGMAWCDREQHWFYQSRLKTGSGVEENS